MKLLLLMTFFLISSCSSSHSVLVYNTSCENGKDLLLKEIIKLNFELREIESYEQCSSLKRYEITLRNIEQEHIDGRKFHSKEIKQKFYAKYNPKKCEVTFIATVNGKATNFKDINHILDKYYFSKLLKDKSDDSPIKFKNHFPVQSEDELNQLCNTLELNSLRS